MVWVQKKIFPQFVLKKIFVKPYIALNPPLTLGKALDEETKARSCSNEVFVPPRAGLAPAKNCKPLQNTIYLSLPSLLSLIAEVLNYYYERQKKEILQILLFYFAFPNGRLPDRAAADKCWQSTMNCTSSQFLRCCQSGGGFFFQALVQSEFRIERQRIGNKWTATRCSWEFDAMAIIWGKVQQVDEYHYCSFLKSHIPQPTCASTVAWGTWFLSLLLHLGFLFLL